MAEATGLAVRTSLALAVLLDALPRPTAAKIAGGVIGALDRFAPARHAPVPVWTPDDLKGREDWVDDLVRAWRHLDATDRAAFLARVTSEDRRAA